MRLLACYHFRTGATTHYIGRKRVDAETFRTKFRELGLRLAPTRPQSTGFGYRIVWEIV